MNDTDQAVPGTKPDRLMRLFEITYKCPICRHHHIMEMYIAAETTDLDELTHKAKNLTNDPDEMIPRFIRAATRIHTKAGNIGYFGQTSQDPNWLQTYTVSIEMTDEAGFTCDECGHTLPTIDALRVHSGFDPETRQRTGDYVCAANAHSW